MTIDTLPQLKAESWDPAMRYSWDQILQRLSVPPRVIFVPKIRDGRLGITGLQRIHDMTWTSEDKLHDMSDSVLQLRRVNTWLESKPTATATGIEIEVWSRKKRTPHLSYVVRM